MPVIQFSPGLIESLSELARKAHEDAVKVAELMAAVLDLAILENKTECQILDWAEDEARQSGETPLVVIRRRAEIVTNELRHGNE